MVDRLPTEILCAVFDLSTVEFKSFIPTDNKSRLTVRRSSSRTTLPATGYELISNPNTIALPSHEDILRHSITLSHVCKRWRCIAIDMHTLWTKMHLCHGAFISKDYHDSEAMETSSIFLSRSGTLPLHLDITFVHDDTRLALSWIQKTRYEENIRRVLLPYIGKCLSLRLESNDFIMTAILDVFLERNLSPSYNNMEYTPLSHLHLVKTFQPHIPLDSSDPGHVQPIFPPDLSIVAPHLTDLYVDAVQIAVFPRWCLERLYLHETFISYHNHFHIFMKTRITTLILHRVTIPGGLPYVRQLTTYHASSVRSLRLSQLRCAGPQAEHRDMYALFFTLSLYRTLHELELSGLNRDAMDGLSAMLGANTASGLVFLDMQTLILRNIKLQNSMVTHIPNMSPALNELVLDRVDGDSELVTRWKEEFAIWPQLTEIFKGDGEANEVRNASL